VAGRLLYVVSEDWAFLSHRLPMARAARAAGFDVHVATRVQRHGATIEAEGFTLHPIPFRRGALSPGAARQTILALRRLETRLRPALLHHSALQACVLGGLATTGRRIPQVNALNGLGYAFTGEAGRAGLMRLAIAQVLRRICNRPHSRALVQNPDDRALLEAIGIRPDRLVTIPGSGVDTDALRPLPEPEGPVTIGFAGRLLTDKGIRALVKAHEIMRARGLDVQLRIAGTPDPANPASVSESEAQAWARRPGVTWLGHVEDITTLWASCHVAALPSHREGLPKALLEAAALGRPMVATDAPGCREVVHHEQTGLLVPIEDPPRLAEALARLAADPALRARYGAAARALVETRMSERAIGSAVVQLYRALLQH
jgi:glycosyltransferase involved in cell wall biosynthesis